MKVTRTKDADKELAELRRKIKEIDNELMKLQDQVGAGEYYDGKEAGILLARDLLKPIVWGEEDERGEHKKTDYRVPDYVQA